MSSKTPQNNQGDDWQAPDANTGKWEHDEITPAEKQRKKAGANASSLFGPLWDDPRARPLLLISLLLLVGVCAVACFVVGLVLISERNALGDLNPFKTNPAGPTSTPRPIPTAGVIVNGTSVPAAVPTELTIGSTVYKIEALGLDAQNNWQNYDPAKKKTGYWASGTMVNYVIGLPTSEDNKAIFNSLKTDDLLFLTTGVGNLRYRVSEISSIKEDDLSRLRDETSPHVTLVLLGEGGAERRVIIANYTDESVANELTAIGVPINLGDVRVMATGQRLLPGAQVGLAAGKNYYQVNLQITNLVTRVVDGGQFFTELADGVGGKYALSETGSGAAGAPGWAKGALQAKGQAGDTMTVTAGFEVPDTMAGPNLTWLFAVDNKAPEIAKVAIPYKPLVVQPTVVPTGAPRADVKIVNANISPEGNELRIVGEITNLTTEPLIVSLADIKLDTASGQPIALNQSIPPLSPAWTISPGAALTFQLNFVRPPGGTEVILTLFDKRSGITVN